MLFATMPCNRSGNPPLPASLIHRVPDAVAEMIGGATSRLQGDDPAGASEALYGYGLGAGRSVFGTKNEYFRTRQGQQQLGNAQAGEGVPPIETE